MTLVSAGAAALRSTIRYVTLDAGGEHVWLYVFTPRSLARDGSPGGGLRVIRLPIVHLQTIPTTGRAEGRDLPSILVYARPTSASKKDQLMYVELDKPAGGVLARVVGGPEGGLQWSKAGVAGVMPAAPRPVAPEGDAAAASATPLEPWETIPSAGSSVPLADVLPRLPASEQARLRRWALLAHVFTGKPVPAAAVRALRLRGGDWALETMRDELDTGGAGATHKRASRLAELLHWHEAPAFDASKGAGSGSGVGHASYWWHDVTWESRWERPEADGRGPAEARAEVLRQALAQEEDSEAVEAVDEGVAAAAGEAERGEGAAADDTAAPGAARSSTA